MTQKRSSPPRRIQRKRTKGFHMPPDAIYVGRPSLFGNPFGGPRAVAVYRNYLTSGGVFAQEVGGDTGVTLKALVPWYHRDEVLKALPLLRGRDLACWCPPDKPCHADVLIELANAGVLASP